MTDKPIAQVAINTIRTLAIDAIQQANSGHPGTPMGMAPVVYYLWQRFLRFDPEDPIWPNRDRFVLSAGHASMLLYSMLYLTGVKAVDHDYEIVGKPSVSLDDIKTFRQLGSRCPGHPEYRWTSGVETTTGPLGQGVATSVGMAIANKWLAAWYNRPGFDFFTADVYALCGDGCMMEGISNEAASLAGHLQLDNLCWIYDNNHVTIEGHTNIAFRDDVASRFLKKTVERPTLIKGLASRDSSSQVLNAIAKRVPWLIGGSADLTPSTKTRLGFDGAGDFQAGSHDGRNLHFGIREHAMAAILNGMSLVKVRPYGSGFFIFSDYARGAIRLSALMELPIIHIFTHDSIGVGEDGPTHQPIEQLANLRALPGLLVIRPCDANEVVEAWKVIMKQRHAPVALILTRQALPTLDRAKYAPAGGLARGAYVLADAPNGQPDVLLLATGSEVALCVQAYEQLAREGIKARVVSMPCWRLFEEQDRTYQESVLPPTVKARVSIEEGSTFGWERYVGENGESLGMHFFGASAPLKSLHKKFGFTPEHVLEAAKVQLRRAG